MKFSPLKLKIKRESQGLTHLDLAFQATRNGTRITPQTLMNWEAGRTKPFTRLLTKVAQALGCDPSEFYE